jgi:soluble lytic murein transglycosylase-like protein
LIKRTHLFALILMFAVVGTGQAQKKSGQPKAQLHATKAQEADTFKQFRDDFIKASEDYKASLEKLLTLYEEDARKVTEQQSKLKALYADGLISRQEYESTGATITGAEAKVAEVRNQIATADLAIAEAKRPPQADDVRNAEMAWLSQNATHWTTGNARIDGLIRDNGRRYGVDPYFIYCVIRQESSFNTTAMSVKGAQGLMQLMPGTAARYGVSNSNDPAQNIRGGTRYLKDLLQLFHGRIDLALAGYNAGEGAVIKYGQNVPPYKETQDYVRLISKRYLQKPTAPAAKETEASRSKNN